MESKVVKVIVGQKESSAEIIQTNYESRIDFSIEVKYKQWHEVHHAETLQEAEVIAKASIATLEALDNPIDKKSLKTEKKGNTSESEFVANA